jgi:lipoprotein-releasing system ATP-binding protein
MTQTTTIATKRAAEASVDFHGERPGAPEAKVGCVLEARNLRKSYGSGEQVVTVLDGANLTITSGEMVAIMGQSGAGKSTLLHLLAALDTPTSGTVYFETKAIESFREAELAHYRNNAVGFVWQRHHLLADFSAVENVAMPLLIRGRAYGEAVRTARQWLEEVGLAERANQRAGELSGGEQQRVAIARALAHGPAVLLADEPTGNLDERNATGVFELMQRLHRMHRLTSILATHNLTLARRADRMVGLEHGVLCPVSETSNDPGKVG